MEGHDPAGAVRDAVGDADPGLGDDLFGQVRGLGRSRAVPLGASRAGHAAAGEGPLGVERNGSGVADGRFGQLSGLAGDGQHLISGHPYLDLPHVGTWVEVWR